ncbi:MAG: PhzF family phenazine biosynthesis protein [Actinocatenispora sp.]
MTELRYEIVDVFTDRPFAGNPLAVVFDAEQLDDDRMQAIAREFNFSETAFVLPPDTAADYRVRIFTPRKELPFAGHPSVGTAATLVRRGMLPAGELVQQCGVGDLPVTATARVAQLAGGAASIGPELDPAPVLAAVGLTEADLAGPAPRLAGCGIDSVHLLVRPDALARIDLHERVLRADGWTLSVSVWNPDRNESLARVFAPDLSVPEDPATGSAALAHGVYLATTGLLPGDGEHSYRVRQGVEIGRPSTLDCSVSVVDGQVVGTTVSGAVAPVATGVLTLA